MATVLIWHLTPPPVHHTCNKTVGFFVLGRRIVGRRLTARCNKLLRHILERQRRVSLHRNLSSPSDTPPAILQLLRNFQAHQWSL